MRGRSLLTVVLASTLLGGCAYVPRDPVPLLGQGRAQAQADHQACEQYGASLDVHLRHSGYLMCMVNRGYRMQWGTADVERIGAPEPPEAGLAAQRECTEQAVAKHPSDMPESRRAGAAVVLVGPILALPFLIDEHREHRRRAELFEADVRACLAERGYRVIPR